MFESHFPEPLLKETQTNRQTNKQTHHIASPKTEQHKFGHKIDHNLEGISGRISWNLSL